ncbi:hypothetical protein [Halostreptopolyspora alba]|uniref:hypothetical protein n=1 Tax=Halostreptopolyspora alba TaxID=2487137 RepID=UPI0011CE77AE
MYPNPDTGRGRRWLVALVPVALMTAVPCVVALIFQSRITHQFLVGGVMATVVMALVIAGAAALSLVRYQRSAALQRQVAAFSAAVSGLFGTHITLHIVTLIDAPVPAEEIRWFGLNEATGWFWIAGLPVAAALGALAWALTPTAPPPEATTTPPEGAPTLHLGPKQKAMLATTTWIRANLLTGTAMLVLGGAVIVANGANDTTLAPGVLFAVIGVWTLAQAHTRLLIDDHGVALTTAGTLRSTIPYGHIARATVLERSPQRAFLPSGSGHGWGATTGTGPALHLQLSDGRAFVFSTHEAETAASLVNGYLHRERTDVDHD